MKVEGALIIPIMHLPFFILSKKQRSQETTITPYNKAILSIIPKGLKRLEIDRLAGTIDEPTPETREDYFDLKQDPIFNAIITCIQEIQEEKKLYE